MITSSRYLRRSRRRQRKRRRERKGGRKPVPKRRSPRSLRRRHGSELLRS